MVDSDYRSTIRFQERRRARCAPDSRRDAGATCPAKSKRVPRWCGVHSSRPVARLMTLARPALRVSLAGTSARSSLGLRAHRQPDKPTLRLGTLSCLQHFFLVRLDQRFAIDPCLPSFSSRDQKVTSLEPRTPHQPEKLKKLSKNDLVVLLLFFTSTKNARL